MTFSTAEAIALVSVVVTILLHSGALFRWGSEVKAMLRELKVNDARQDAEILRLRDWKHDQLAPWATQMQERVGILEDRAERSDS